MKKKWKVFWITCAVSGIIGTVLLMVSFVLGVTFQQIESMMPTGISIIDTEDTQPSEDEIHVSDENYYENSSHIYEGISALDIKLTAGKVEILTSNSADVEVVTENISEKLKLTYYRDGNTLVVDSRDKLNGIVNQNLGTIYIYLPQGMKLYDANISVGAGTLYVEELEATELSVEVGAGEALIDGFLARQAEFNCGAGELTIYGDAKEKAEIDCGMGNISYYTSDSEESYNYELTCGVGVIQCGTNKYSGINSEQRVDNHASKEMNINCGVGEVTVEFESL